MVSMKKIFMVTALGVALALAGCGTQKTEQAQNSKTTQEATADNSPKKLTIADGTKNMRDVIKEMKTELSNKEEDKAIKTSDNLEGNWKQFEDNVKAKSPTLYEKIEDPLHTINAAVKVKPLDVNTLNTAIDKLDAALAELQKL